MKGDTCFSNKNQSIRPVFKAIGSLLCWRLQSEWEGQKHKYVSNSIAEQLLPRLKSASTDGSPPDKSWSRWRSHSNGDSAFAGGSLRVAKQVLLCAARLNLINSVLAVDTCKFFRFLASLGFGKVSLDDDDFENRLSRGYSVIFELACIDPVDTPGIFLNLDTNTKFTQADFYKSFKVNVADAKAHAIDSAFVALSALAKLEEAIQGAHNVLEGIEPSQKADLAVVRELVLAFYANEATGLVHRIHACMQLTHKSGGNTKDLVKTALKPLLASMTAEVKNLRM